MHIPLPRLSRRAFLRGIGVSMALPALECMTPARAAAAAASSRPTRMAVLYMPNGVRPDAWTPKGIGRGFELSPMLSPLAGHKDDLLVLTQLWNQASNTGDGHYVKTGGFLTGTTITRTTGENLSANGISMDQLCAEKIGHLTKLPSLELGIVPPATGVDPNVGYTQLYGANISWPNARTPATKEIVPKQAFDRLFRTQQPTADRTAAAAREKSILDLVGEDARRLAGKLGQGDKEKLEEYFESVRAVERRIEWDAKRQQATMMNDPAARAMIEEFGQRVNAYAHDPAAANQRKGDPSQHVRLMLEMMALAFWTDSTRISTFMFGNAVSGRSFAFLDPSLEGHHETSHHQNKADKLADYQRIGTWHVEQYAWFLDKLKSLKEDGKPLLDQCMVMFGAGMRDGNAHDPHNLPIVLAGKGGGSVATGRHLIYEKNSPLTNLYRSMLKTMGTPVEQFADSTGELAGFSDPAFTGKAQG